MQVIESAYVGTRIRFKRAKDNVEFYGWVNKFNSSNVIVKLDQDEDVTPSQLYNFEAVGPQQKLYFSAALDGIVDKVLTFYIMGGVRAEESDEKFRVKMHKMFGKIKLNEKLHDVEILDASAGGFSFSIKEQVEVDTEMSVEMRVKSGLVECITSARYCKPMEGDDSLYRVGAQITSIKRVDSKRWSMMLDRSEFV